MRDLNALSLPALFAELTADGSLDRLVDAAWHEDLGSVGDVTTESIIAPDQSAVASMRVREAGTISGLAALPSVVRRFGGPGVTLELPASDGVPVAVKTEIARLSGSVCSILAMERTALNLVGRMSGIATMTRRNVDAIAGTKAVLCDTRKTTPGMRALDKYAVRCGGGTLHRIGLFDAALYKDNHLAGIAIAQLASRLESAVRAVRKKHQVRFVEVEVDSLAQMEELLRLPTGLIDIILLDNLPPKTLREAVGLRNRKRSEVQLEASGGVNLDTIRGIAETGVDRISVGAITHSASCLDVGLDIE